MCPRQTNIHTIVAQTFCCFPSLSGVRCDRRIICNRRPGHWRDFVLFDCVDFIRLSRVTMKAAGTRLSWKGRCVCHAINGDGILNAITVDGDGIDLEADYAKWPGAAR